MPPDDLKTDKYSFHSISQKPADYEPNEDYFSEEDGSYDPEEEDKKKIKKFLEKYENKLAGLVLWCGHAIIGGIPIVVSATGFLNVIIAVMLTTMFMTMCFIVFIHNQGLKYLNHKGISLDDIDIDSSDESSPPKHPLIHKDKSKSFKDSLSK